MLVQKKSPANELNYFENKPADCGGGGGGWKSQRNAFFWSLKLVTTACVIGRVHGLAQPEIIIKPELPALRDAIDLWFSSSMD